MTINSSDIYDSLVHNGYYKSSEPVSRDQFELMLDELAQRLDPVDIRVGMKHPNLGGTQELPAHNDCSYFADGLAWYCVYDGGAGDRLYISPMAPIEATLTADDLEHLAHAQVTMMRQRVPRTNLVRHERGRPILFCPFGACSFDETIPGRRQAVDSYYQRIREVAQAHRVRRPGMGLRSGEFLIVDDRRYIHGRDLLPEGTNRVLHRSYLVMRDREHWLTQTVEHRPFGVMHPRRASTDCSQGDLS